MKKLLILATLLTVLISCTSKLIKIEEPEDIKFLYKQPYRKIIVVKYDGREYMIYETENFGQILPLPEKIETENKPAKE